MGCYEVKHLCDQLYIRMACSEKWNDIFWLLLGKKKGSLLSLCPNLFILSATYLQETK